VRSPCTAPQAGGFAEPELQVEVESWACEALASRVKPRAKSFVAVRCNNMIATPSSTRALYRDAILAHIPPLQSTRILPRTIDNLIV